MLIPFWALLCTWLLRDFRVLELLISKATYMGWDVFSMKCFMVNVPSEAVITNH